MEEENTSVEVELKEGSAASDTLKPGGGSSGGQSKAEMLATFTQLMSQLGKEDLSNWLNDSLAKIGHEADSIPSGSAEKNKSSVSMKEDVNEMFEGDDLSEEFKDKALTIVEAVVNTRIAIETARLEENFETLEASLVEQYQQTLNEEVDEIFEDLSNKLHQYLNHIAESWMKENKLSIESSIRAEIAENFMTGLQNLFAEHYISVPEERFDIIGEMRSEIEELKNKLNETTDMNLQLNSIIDEANKSAIIDDMSEGLAETQIEKLRTLSENVEFTDVDSYIKQVSIIKENFFNKKPAVNNTGLIVESIDGTNGDDSTEILTPQMNEYAKALSKSKI